MNYTVTPWCENSGKIFYMKSYANVIRIDTEHISKARDNSELRMKNCGFQKRFSRNAMDSPAYDRNLKTHCSKYPHIKLIKRTLDALDFF